MLIYQYKYIYITNILSIYYEAFVLERTKIANKKNQTMPQLLEIITSCQVVSDITS